MLAVFAGTPVARAGESCRVTVSAVAFGVYDPTREAPTESRGEIIVECTGAAAGQVLGVALDGPGAPRTLRQGRDVLRYGLYRDAMHARPWSSATSVRLAGDATRAGEASARIPVYGAIAPGQWSRPGGYGDTVQIVLTY